MSINSRSSFGTALAIAASLSVAACGGGGGGKDDSPATPAVTKSVGVASKGILSGAVVRAYELAANGERLRAEPVGEAKTDDNGRYELTIGAAYSGGPLLFELTGDAGTRMTCDVPVGCGTGAAFGTRVPVDAGFKLLAIVPSAASGQSLSVQLTPFTTMAARRALNDDRGVNANTVAQANSETSQLVGVNILTTEPVDLTRDGEADDDAKVYAAFLAGVGSLAYSRPGGLNQLIEDLGETFADGAFAADDKVTIQDLVTAVRTTAAATQLRDKLPSKVSQALEVIEAGIVDGGYDPEPSPVANDTALAKGKALVKEARTLLTSVAALEEPVDALGADAHTAARVLSQEVIALAELAAKVVDYVALEAPSETSVVVELQDRAGEPVGTLLLEVSESDAGTEIAVSSIELPGGVKLELLLKIDQKFNDVVGGEAIEFDRMAISLSGYLESAGARLDLAEVGVDIVLKEAVSHDLETGEFSRQPQISTASLVGELAITAKDSGARFKGVAGLSVVGLDTPNAYNEISLQRVSLLGSFSSPDKGEFSAKVALNIDNAASFDTFAYLAHDPEIYMYERFDVDDTARALAEQATAAVSASFIYSYHYRSYDGDTIVWFDRSGVGGVVSLGGDPLGVAAYATNLAQERVAEWGFPTAEIRNIELWHATPHDMANGGEQIWVGATVDIGDFENADYFARGSLSLTLDLALQGHPQTTATATVNRTGFDSGDAQVTFSHGGRQWTISTRKPSGEKVSAIEIANPDGVTMAIDHPRDGSYDGNITVDGERVGRLETTGNGLVLIRWADGTFESLQ